MAIWFNYQILLIKTSYKKEYTLPGGYIKQGEDKEVAALRELKEELNINIDPGKLTCLGQFQSNREYKKDTTYIFEIHLKDQPMLKKDNREVIWTEFTTPEDALNLNLSQYARSYLSCISHEPIQDKQTALGKSCP